MKLFRLPIIVSLFILSSLTLVLCSHAPTTNRLLRVSDGRILSLTDIVRDLAKCRLVFVGEIHTNEKDHRAQLEVIRALKKAGAPVVIGLEMFRRDSQSELDRWVEGKLSEKEFEKVYYQNWNYPWALYKDIFLYAREQKIPMLGLNISPKVTKQVAREGFDSLTAKQRGSLPMVTCRVDPEYMAFIRRALAMHGHSGLEFTRFCEAQLVWDTAMALSLLHYLDKHPKSTVVVLAGNGHAWKQGIPAQIRSRSNLPLRVILPQIPERVEPGKVSEYETDYLWLGLN
jgi:uncharacterized iron-regulated protein